MIDRQGPHHGVTGAGPTRRELLRTALAAPLWGAFARSATADAAIDRRGLVRRHPIVLTASTIDSPCQVGNGEFAVTVDITGVQTFVAEHDAGMPLGTMAQWAWHSFPAPAQLDLDDIYTPYDSHGRQVSYADGKGGYDAEAPPGTPHPAVWRRANPHRFHLGRVGFVRPGQPDRPLRVPDIGSPRQELDLWTGAIESRFVLDGETVFVSTVCHPTLDALSVRVRSRLVARGVLGLVLAFPYAAGEWRRAADWLAADRHQTSVAAGASDAVFSRTLDGTHYVARAAWSGTARLTQAAPHTFELAGGTDEMDLTVRFSPTPTGRPPAFPEVRRAAADHWRRFWTTGAALDLADVGDPRARELERRVVLSQYVTAVNCAGSMPPQETGLVTNSWYGKHHLEMHWWHAAHFPLWGRPDLLARSLPWYHRILPEARAIARRQRYRGARWPKQVGSDGRESPSGVAAFLVWQQPHPIAFAELLYRARPRRDTLDAHADLVFESAEFMASFAAWDAGAARFVLGPPLIPAQESYGSLRARVVNPTFELAYWSWGLSTAQAWRERLGLAREPQWDRVLAHLARPTVRGGLYAGIETDPFTIYSDHPSMLAALGVLPASPSIDAAVMRRTLDDVLQRWVWATTWGWDYGLMAMTAARLGDPARAIDCLLLDTPKNLHLQNGHNFQAAGRLPLYLPGNGALLYAVALMAGGWDGAPSPRAPGFPANPSWRVRVEGFGRAI